MEIIENFDNAMKIMQTDELSQLFLERRKRHIKLAPKFLGSLKPGIKQHLSALLSKQESKFDGFPVAYSNIKIGQAYGKLISDQACIHLDVEADFIVFRPTVGCKLTGKVNKISKKHLGCLVHGHFNAWVPQTPATEKLAASMLMGAQLEFTVQGVDSSRSVLSIRGKLDRILNERVDKSCVSIHPLTLTPSEQQQLRKQIKKEEEEKELRLGGGDQADSGDIQKGKSKKKRNKKTVSQTENNVKDEVEVVKREAEDIAGESHADSGVNLPIGLQESDEPKKHKKKKKKDKKNKNKDSGDSCVVEESGLGEFSVHLGGLLNTSVNSVESFEPEFTRTQVIPDRLDDRTTAKKKKKKHKKEDEDDKTNTGYVNCQVDLKVIVNGDREVNRNDSKSNHKGKTSRKRHHEDESLIKIETPEKSHSIDNFLVEPSSAKKVKQESESVDHDLEIGSRHSKKSKKKKKHLH